MWVMSKKFWGLEAEEILLDGQKFWRIPIRNPFFESGRYRIGINTKLLAKAREAKVDRLMIKVGQQERTMELPTPEGLRMKEERGEYEDRKSMFTGSPPMRIYYFSV